MCSPTIRSRPTACATASTARPCASSPMKKWKPRATDICCICLKNRMQAVGNSHAKYHQHITAYRTAAGQSDMLFSGTLNEPISKRRSTRYLFQISSYSIPPGSLDAGSRASDIFGTDRHNIAKQTAFVNRCAEVRLRWKAACFLPDTISYSVISASARWQSIYPFSS